MPDTSDRTERVAELQQAAVPHPASAGRQAISAIDAIYQDGLIVPSRPLDLAEGTPLHIHVEVQPAPPQPAIPLDLAAAFRLLLALSALALALFAQYTFMAGHSFSWTAFGAAIVAVGMFAGALHRAPLPFQPAEPVPLVAQPAIAWLPWRSAMLIGALVCTAIVLLALATPFIANYNVYLVPWLAAIALVLGAFGQARRPARAATPFWPALAPAACITLLAFGLRAWRLDQFPATLGGDEAAQGLESVNVLHGILANPFVTGWTSVPTMSFYVAVPSLAIFGQTITALRLPWALVGTASVLATYLLAARLHGRLVACLAAGLLAGFHYHVHFSRLGSNQIADTLFVPAALLCLVQGYRLRRAGAWAWCGVWVGLAQFFYAGARFTAILIAITVAWFAIREGRSFLAARRTELAALLAGVLVTAAPMIQYAIRFPNEYNGRFNTVGIFQPGWFEAEMELTGRTVPHILNEQFWSAFLAYNATSDRTTWYGSGEPFFGLL
ncbi:MAG TPA: glycosyltransferase family 39 protein, partial [Roseiflexaceae bacterium]|nr:glycosyltransferase family 39 protein [Roseiflexaceae bacterium]